MKKKLLDVVLLFFFLLTGFVLVTAEKDEVIALPPCDNLIYCHGPLLRTVQLAGLGGDFKDSKYFVDMTLIDSPEKTLQKFTRLMNDTDHKPSSDKVRQFVDANFLPPNSEFTNWVPEDWTANPDFLKNVIDPDLEEWAKALNKLWKVLGRQIDPQVETNQNKHSLIYVSHPFIVPGGRFRETYYWDSYWTVEGLLLSEMKKTVKGMLENFIELVNKYGLVPNGNRVYYTRRSQPPYLIPMFKLYFDNTKDTKFIEKNIDVLEREYKFWEKDRTQPVRAKDSGKIHHIAQYKVEISGPRPESYKEDYHLAQELSTNNEREKLYHELKSGAESGWDYSTRWFVKGNSNQGDLSDINVTAIAPVDLNSLLCYNAQILRDFYTMLGNEKKAKEFSDKVHDINSTLADLFWDEERGIWYDVNIHTGDKRRYFYMSNFHPLFSGCFGAEGSQKRTMEKVMKYLKKEAADTYIGGVPTSLRADSHEQWDYPNAWAPLQHILITGLYKNRHLHPEAEDMALKLAKKWIRTNYEGYRQTKEAQMKINKADPKGVMFEKYNVNVLGVAGEGGEYPVVSGFGWTNGVAMELLNIFGDRLTPTVASGTIPQLSTILMITLVTFSSLLKMLLLQ